jgi:hypothetical protein
VAARLVNQKKVFLTIYTLYNFCAILKQLGGVHMVLTLEERKARREAGMAQAQDKLTFVQKIRRAHVNGRPQASELRTPIGALMAAKTLDNDLRQKLDAEQLKIGPRDVGVCVGYVSTDLSVLGFTPIYESGAEARIERMLHGQIPIGLIFGIRDKEGKRKGDEAIVTGTRPFLATKQVDAWLSELETPVRLEIEG